MENNTTAEVTKDRFAKYVMPTYAPKLVFERGEGSYLYDTDGNKFLDFGAGISVCNLGHCHPYVTKAIAEQAAKLVHVSNIYMNTIAPKLAEKLINFGFDGKVFFCNSGAEANEGLIKIARKWGNQTNRNEIIAMENSFHGRTLATLAATGRSKYREGFEPNLAGFTHVDFNDIEAIKSAITPQTCAILLEPLQGEGGIIPAEESFLKELRQLCDEKNILLMFDEIQCGMGRMGTLFAFQSFGVTPDAISMAKALGNGFPIGAFIVKREYADTLTVGTHGSTFGGTALGAAAALATLEAYEQDDILANVSKMSQLLIERLTEIIKPYNFIEGIRGRGLMIGIVLDSSAAPLQELLFNYNLITLTAGENVLRLLPPLNVTEEQCIYALDAIEKALAEFAATK